MACSHKFEEYLTLQRIDFEPTTLLVGTFNPSWPINNKAEWFYGRVRNNYCWDVLPRLYDFGTNLRGAKAADWKAFCSEKRIALTDMITCINDANEHDDAHRKVLGGYLDTSIAKRFKNFTFTDIDGLLQKHPTIQNVYLTRLPGLALFDEQWALVEAYGQKHGLHVRNLLTPSANARFQIGPHKQIFPDDRESLRNFIFGEWVQQWHI